MKALRLSIAAAAGALCLARACGGETLAGRAGSPDASPDALDDAEVGAPDVTLDLNLTPTLDCPKPPLAACPGPGVAFSTVTASELGLTRFTQAWDHWVLAERETDAGVEPVAIRLEKSGNSVAPAVVASLPTAEPLEARALSGTGDLPVAMLCKGATCSVYEVTSPSAGPELTAVAGATIPAVLDAHGVVRVAATPSLVCAFGDGLACFAAGSWSFVVPPGSGPTLLAASSGGSSIWAVGQGGRMLKADASGFAEVTSGVGADLLSVDAHDGLVAAGGDGGALLLRGPGVSLNCAFGSDPWIMARAINTSPPGINAVGAAGETLRSWAGWCLDPPLTPEPPIAATVWTCGASGNLRLVTDQTIVGTNYCAMD